MWRRSSTFLFAHATLAALPFPPCTESVEKIQCAGCCIRMGGHRTYSTCGFRCWTETGPNFASLVYNGRRSIIGRACCNADLKVWTSWDRMEPHSGGVAAESVGNGFAVEVSNEGSWPWKSRSKRQSWPQSTCSYEWCRLTICIVIAESHSSLRFLSSSSACLSRLQQFLLPTVYILKLLFCCNTSFLHYQKKAKGFEQIMSGVRAGAELSWDYCRFIICAALIAAVGLGKAITFAL